MGKGLEQCDKCDYYISVEEAYQAGASDMEKAKQVIIDKLLAEIEQVREDTIDECIRVLDRYAEQPMTDEYEIKECISVLEQLKEQEDGQTL